MREIHAGATSQTIYVEVLNSSSTTGARLTGLAFNTASLIGYYVRNGGSATAITLATLAAANSAWATGGFKEVDATHMAGIYRLDVPDAAFAAGAVSVVVTLSGAANMVQVSEEVQLIVPDNQDGVRYGLTALPNAAANAAGGLPVSIAGGLDLDEMNVDIEAIQTSTSGLTFTGANKVDASVRDWVGDTIPARNVTGVPLIDVEYWDGVAIAEPATDGVPDVNVKNMNNVAATSITTINANIGETQPINFTGTGASALVQTDVTDWKAATAPAMTGDAYARLGAPAGASIAADIAEIEGETDAIGTSTAGLTFTVANQVDANVLDWKSATAPAMTGDAYARLGAPAGASIAADIAEVEGETDTLLAGVTVTTNNDKTGYTVSTNQDKTGYTVSTNSDKTGYSLLLSQVLSAPAATDGTQAHTVGEALNAARAQGFGKWTITGTTLKLFAPDGATLWRQFTLDSASAPTSRT